MSFEDSPQNVPPPPPPPASDVALTADEKQWAMFCHLSALLGLLAAGLTFIGPLVCWLMKKDTSPFVDDQGKEALNFQLNILIYSIVSVVIGALTCFGLVLVPIVLVYGIVMPIIGGLQANKGERYRYPLTFRIIK
jgi:uncharacterized Tic20 family protein